MTLSGRGSGSGSAVLRPTNQWKSDLWSSVTPHTCAYSSGCMVASLKISIAVLPATSRRIASTRRSASAAGGGGSLAPLTPSAVPFTRGASGFSSLGSGGAVRMCGSAPCPSSTLASTRDPRIAAMCSAVNPRASSSSGSAPCCNRYPAICPSPTMAARCNSGSPRHRCRMSQPRLTKTRTPSICLLKMAHTTGVCPSGLGSSTPTPPSSMMREATSQRDSTMAYASAADVFSPSSRRTSARRPGCTVGTRSRAGDGVLNSAMNGGA
mmetsp:Transcript_53977/g.166063  ORF Transcript_53977/g.166063 Transcript_53977/m.166063 type:complete len:267 (-) Transcript_53977:24-824(-)